MKEIPVIHEFIDDEGNDCMEGAIKTNYDKIKADVRLIVAMELARINKDPRLGKYVKND
ncbi:MAG: hypothetical protein NC328_07920 [Muribaculum sp.]|nr:hypothetical protein [Muribaculum sp.]